MSAPSQDRPDVLDGEFEPESGGLAVHEADAPRRRWWRRRATNAPIVDVPAPRNGDMVPYDDALPTHSAIRRWADRHTAHLGIPDSRKIKASAGYWARTTPKLLVVAAPKMAKAAISEIAPIAVGAGVATEAVLRWLAVPDLTAAVLTAESPNKKADLAKKLHGVKARRLGALGVSATTAFGGGVYLYYTHLSYLLLAGFIIFGVLDWRGRKDKPEKPFAPAVRPLFQEGMPLRSLTESILTVLAEEAIEASPDGVIRWDPDAKQYRLVISTYGKVTDETLRAVERGVGFPDYSIKMLSTPVATNKELVIQYGDPLAVVPKPPEFPPLSLSVSELLPLGVSIVDMPFAFSFAGARISVVATSGGGKTKVHIRNMIYVLSRCKDSWLCGIDLQAGPELSLWKHTIRKKAFTPKDADELLSFLITEMYERMKQLNVTAEDAGLDDEASDEWNASLGPYIFLFIDEFPVLTEYDGKAGRLDLLGKVILLMRLGRKVGIGTVRAAQATGNQDSGSTLLTKLTSISLVGPCAMADSDAVFTPDKRRAGFTPHMLEPADLHGNINDAGKCYVGCQGYGPHVYRGYAPLSTGEVRRRDLEAAEAGLPELRSDTMDAIEVPPALAAVEAALDNFGLDKAPSAKVLEHANDAIQVGAKWTAKSLAEALREECKALGVPAVQARDGKSLMSGNRSAQHFYRSDLIAAMAALDGQP